MTDPIPLPPALTQKQAVPSVRVQPECVETDKKGGRSIGNVQNGIKAGLSQNLSDGRIDTGQPDPVRTAFFHDQQDRKSTRLNSSHTEQSRMPSSA